MKTISQQKIIRHKRSDVAKRMGWSTSTLRDRLKEDAFIKPTYEGRTPYWLSTDVDVFIQNFFKGK